MLVGVVGWVVVRMVGKGVAGVGSGRGVSPSAPPEMCPQTDNAYFCQF